MDIKLTNSSVIQITHTSNNVINASSVPVESECCHAEISQSYKPRAVKGQSNTRLIKHFIYQTQHSTLILII
jgi:hypothetical protein